MNIIFFCVNIYLENYWNLYKKEFAMSGHSKWATIKHAKGLADAKRGKIFTACK